MDADLTQVPDELHKWAKDDIMLETEQGSGALITLINGRKASLGDNDLWRVDNRASKPRTPTWARGLFYVLAAPTPLGRTFRRALHPLLRDDAARSHRATVTLTATGPGQILMLDFFWPAWTTRPCRRPRP